MPVTATMGPDHMNHDMHAGHDMSSHTGHDMSSHTGHDMSSHAGHDMSSHAGHDMGNHADHMGHHQEMRSGAEATEAGGDHSHFLYMSSGHGDGVLQAGVKEVLLFKGAATTDAGTLFFACLIMVLCGVLLEYFRLLAWWLESRYVRCSGGVRNDSEDINTCNPKKRSENGNSELMSKGHANYSTVSGTCGTAKASSSRQSWLMWAALGLLHAVNYVFGTCLMLITMTFNIYLICSIATGVAVGKLATMYTRSRLTVQK